MHFVIVIDHLRSGVVYIFGPVCLSDNNFRKSGRRKFIFAHAVYLQGIRLSSYMEVIGSRSRSEEPKKSKTPIPTV